MTRPIFFLTDFGLTDTYVGVVKAVILGIAPEARIVDLTHDVPPQDVRAGAFALLTAAPYLPSDAVVLAVVDPGVGTERRPIAIQLDGRTFVGPDTGLLSWAVVHDLTFVRGYPSPSPENLPISRRCGTEEGAMNEGAMNCAPTAFGPVGAQFIAPAGGEVNAVILDRPRFWRPAVSATFHGRDLFGPVAAHLARGVPLTEVGSPCGSVLELPFPPVRHTMDAGERLVAVHGEIVHVDRYGNLISNLGAADLPPESVVKVAGRTIVGLSPHFQPAGDLAGADDLIALIGSAGLLEVAVPNGSAARALGIGVGAAVTVAGAISPSAPARPAASR